MTGIDSVVVGGTVSGVGNGSSVGASVPVGSTVGGCK